MTMASEPPAAEEQHVKGAFFGGDLKMDSWEKARGQLTAFDAATGKEKWNVKMRKPMIGGAVATAGDLILVGELTGDLDAFDAHNGKELVTRNVGGPIGGGLISYESAGHQRIAVISGYVGYYNILAPDLGGANPTVTVFALSK